MLVDDVIPIDKRMKIGQAAELLQVSEGTMRNKGAAGVFKMWKHPVTGHRYFDREEILAFAAKNFGPPPSATAKRRPRPR